MALRREILAWCDETLQVGLFKDYAPNGLQVEGKEEIAKIATSVTASKAAIDFAVGQGGGYAFWFTTACFGKASLSRLPVGKKHALKPCCNTKSIWRATTCRWTRTRN